MGLAFHDYILFLLLLIALITDVKDEKLPNWLTMSGICFGLIYHLIVNGIDGFIFSVLGMLVAGGIFLVLYFFKALGAGDVKLFAAIGAIVGMQLVLYMMMYSILFAGLLAIIILLFTRTFLQRVTQMLFNIIGAVISKDLSGLKEYQAGKQTKFPFMYAVIPATIAAYSFFLSM